MSKPKAYARSVRLIMADGGLVDSTNQFGFVGGVKFGTSRPDHSGEFTKPIQNALPFYRAVLDSAFDLRPQL